MWRTLWSFVSRLFKIRVLSLFSFLSRPFKLDVNVCIGGEQPVQAVAGTVDATGDGAETVSNEVPGAIIGVILDLLAV